MRDYNIRAAREGELNLMPALERAADQLFIDIGIFEDEGDDWQGTPLEELSRGRLSFAVDAADNPVGYIQRFDVDRFTHINQLGVDPAHGKRGLGRALVEMVIAEARAMNQLGVTLSTFRHVPFNGPWYASMGFEIVSVMALGQAYHRMRMNEHHAKLDITQRDLMILHL